MNTLPIHTPFLDSKGLVRWEWLQFLTKIGTVSPWLSEPPVVLTDDYLIKTTDVWLSVQSAADIVVTLPKASESAGRVLWFFSYSTKKTISSEQNILAPTLTDEITSARDTRKVIICNGVHWLAI